MASTSLRLLSFFFVLLATGQSSEGLCTQEELNAILICIVPYNQQFIDAFGDGNVCDRLLINTTNICQLFGQIVTCIMEDDSLSNVTCLPTAPQQINPLLGDIPCKVEDFYTVCKEVPNPWNFGITTATPDVHGSTTDSDDTGGSGRTSAAQYLWLASLMTTFLAMMMSADNY